MQKKRIAEFIEAGTENFNGQISDMSNYDS